MIAGDESKQGRIGPKEVRDGEIEIVVYYLLDVTGKVGKSYRTVANFHGYSHQSVLCFFST